MVTNRQLGSRKNVAWKFWGKGKWGSTGLKATEVSGNSDRFVCKMKYHLDVVNGCYRWCSCLPGFRIGDRVFYPGRTKGIRLTWLAKERMTRFAESSARNSRCMCGDRIVGECPGEWEPGCDLGANEKYVKVVEAPELNLNDLTIRVVE